VLHRGQVHEQLLTHAPGWNLTALDVAPNGARGQPEGRRGFRDGNELGRERSAESLHLVSQPAVRFDEGRELPVQELGEQLVEGH
jgi:hypothetical protein